MTLAAQFSQPMQPWLAGAFVIFLLGGAILGFFWAYIKPSKRPFAVFTLFVLAAVNAVIFNMLLK